MLKRRRLAGVAAALALLGCTATTAAGAAGDPDPAFGTAGRVQIDLGASEVAVAVALRPDGRIILGGTRGSSGPVAQLTPEGAVTPASAAATAG